MNAAQKIAYLSQYKQIDLEIDRMIHEVDVWKKRLEPFSTEEEKVRVIHLLRHINREIDRLVDLREAMERSIRTVDDKTLQTLLRCRYIDGLTWEALAEQMVYSYQHVFRLHKKAIDLLELDQDVIQC
jgi:DNA-directed RNA polymerase specialized sigma subunit